MKHLILTLIILFIATTANAESTFVKLTPQEHMIANLQRRQAVFDLQKKLSEIMDDSFEAQRERRRLNRVHVYYVIIDEYSRFFGGVLIHPSKQVDYERMAEELKVLQKKAQAEIDNKPN